MARQTEAIRKLVDRDLADLTPLPSSWHGQYSQSAYIYVGNLDLRLTEGDVVTVFSQFGDIVDVNLSRDKVTGKSMGFGFIAFENQKSTVLAIDNMIGFSLLGKPLSVDHVADYRPPRRFDANGDRIPYTATGAEGHGIGVYNVTESQRQLAKSGALPKPRPKEDEDEAWAKSFEQQLKQEDVKRERSRTPPRGRDR